MSMRTEPFSFIRNGLTLRGLIDFPAGRPPLAGILLVPGHGPTNVAGGKYFLALRNQFTAAGLACCTWDRPGCGGSEGAYDINQTVKDSGEEAAVALDAFSKQTGLGLGRVGFWGGSRGTGISQAALRLRPSLGFWIALSPPSDHDNLPYCLETNLRLEGRSAPEVSALMAAWREGERICRTGGTYGEYQKAVESLQTDPFITFLRSMGDYGIYSEGLFHKEQARHRAGEYDVDERTEVKRWPMDGVPGIRCPVLIVLGEKDTLVDWLDSARCYREAFAAGAHPDATIRTLPGANHNLAPCGTGSLREMVEQKFPDQSSYEAIVLTWLRQRGFADEPRRTR